MDDFTTEELLVLHHFAHESMNDLLRRHGRHYRPEDLDAYVYNRAEHPEMHFLQSSLRKLRKVLHSRGINGTRP